MYVGGMDRVAYNWFRSSRMNLYIAPPNCFEYRSGIECCLIKCSVAMDGGNTQEFGTGIVGAEKEGIGILMTRL
jgi:hypothetical protein